MLSFFEYASSAVHKIVGQNACIIAGAIFGFVIQLVIIILWGAISRRVKKNKPEGE